jgi:hypothetical protein
VRWHSSGGYIILGIEQDKTNNVFIKNGFDRRQEEYVGQRIGNDMYNVEPTPEVVTKYLYDRNKKFYAVLKVQSEDTKKPYFTRDKCQCYTRVSNSSKPAGRSVILNLAMNKMVSRDELHRHTEYLTRIYERLTGLNYNTRYEFIRLEVPDDYNQYKLRVLYLNLTNPGGDPTTYSDIKYLKHLDWAISHLTHDEYFKIHQLWLEINGLITRYNKGVLGFLDLFEEQLRQQMKVSYSDFVDLNEDGKWPPNGYSLKNISRLFYLDSRRAILDDTTPKFEKLKNTVSQRGENSYVIEGMGTLVQSQQREDLRPEKLIMILYILHKETRAVEYFSEQQKITDKIFDLCKHFSKQLELLIDDFKGGETIKGFCKLGY